MSAEFAFPIGLVRSKRSALLASVLCAGSLLAACAAQAEPPSPAPEWYEARKKELREMPAPDFRDMKPPPKKGKTAEEWEAMRLRLEALSAALMADAAQLDPAPGADPFASAADARRQLREALEKAKQ